MRSSSISTIVTKPATITIYDAILILFGINLRKSEITTFEQISTAVVVSPIPIPFVTLVVTARVGHIPSISTRGGFSRIKPFINA